jgi:uncharacterized protein (TIGR03382 family)
MRRRLSALLLCACAAEPPAAAPVVDAAARLVDPTGWTYAVPGAKVTTAVDAGDVDGDGWTDLAVAVLYASNVAEIHGFRGGAAGLSTAPDWVLALPGARTRHPVSLAAGDLDGDGRPDLVVGDAGGTPDLDGDGDGDLDTAAAAAPRTGRVSWFGGGAGGWDATPGWTWALAAPRGAVGASVAVGDHDGDGDLDLAVGDPQRREACAVDTGASGRTGASARRDTAAACRSSAIGAVYLFFGEAGGDLGDAPAATRVASEGELHLGRRLAFVDVDGGVAAALLVGADARALGFDGGGDPFPEPPRWDARSNLTSLGDVTGDGAADLGAWHPRAPASSLSAFPDAAWSTALPPSVDALWRAGDLDGDGADDLAAVSPGVLRWFRGGAAGPSLSGSLPIAHRTAEVAPVADVDGDGAREVVVLAAGVATLYEGVTDPSDGDGDGAPPGADCDDADPGVHPGVTEILGDGVDQDCDGYDACPGDRDRDGAAGPPVPDWAPGCVHFGELPVGTPETDCDDLDGRRAPTRPELPSNGIDDDCDGSWACYADVDGDGAVDPAPISSDDADCDDPGELDALPVDTGISSSDRPSDWSHSGPFVPGTDAELTERPSDTDTGRTDGATDPTDFATDPTDAGSDATDGGSDVTDGVSDLTDAVSDASDAVSDATDAVSDPAGFDSDPTDTAIPEVPPCGVVEVPGDGLDGDCDGTELCFADGDGDGFGDGVFTSADLDCDDRFEARLDGDCDDADVRRAPGRPEGVGDGFDADCDGLELCYVDADRDGAIPGDTVAAAAIACDAPGLSSAGAFDCDDADRRVYTSASEPVGSPERNCDGAVVCWIDADQDGYHAGLTEVAARLDCDAPGLGDAGTLPGDCDDTNADANPGEREYAHFGLAEDSDVAVDDVAVGDGVDQDCDGLDEEVEFDVTDGPSGALETDPPTDPPTDAPSGCGCAEGGGPPGLLAAAVAGWAVRRRRRAPDAAGRIGVRTA